MLLTRGIAFSNAYSTSPESNSSRASIFTGRYPHQTGIYNETTQWKDFITPNQTFNSYLKDLGYYTLATGNLHPFITDSLHGVHLFHTSGALGVADTLEQGTAAGINWAILDGDDSCMVDEKAIRFACDYLHKPLPKPFLMMVGLNKPAAPFHIPQKYFEEYPKDSVYLPQIQNWDLDDISLNSVYGISSQSNIAYTQKDSLNDLFAVSRAYMASISYMDAQLGRILESMITSNNMHNTIVILVGDNGMLMGEKHHMGTSSLWEESLHVPLLISVPHQRKSRHRCFNTVDVTSIFPTICDLIDVKPPGYATSESLVPMLRNPYKYRKTVAYSQLCPENISIRTKEYRYIEYKSGALELYDEKKDNYEWYNLAYNSKYKSIIVSFNKLKPSENIPYYPPTIKKVTH